MSTNRDQRERPEQPGASHFHARNPATGQDLEPAFVASTAADLDQAAAAAVAAFPILARSSGSARAAFLRAIATELESRTPALVARAHSETALPEARLQGETARTCNQLRLFAALVEEGSWVDARLDRTQDRPAPAGRKPDLRSLLRPLGPVAVFGASNFPLAFSVAGGDTASALAAGNPVIVKAHPAHPGASALAGEAITAAARACGLPAGVFALLMDPGIEIGVALVQHPSICAVGFTGSLTAGRRLMDLAAARPSPIPVFAEMASSNPVVVLPRALAERGAEIAKGLHASITQGAGQFCTKPGLVLVPQGEHGGTFLQHLSALIAESPGYTLLTEGIARAFIAGAATRGDDVQVKTLAQAKPATPSASAAAAHAHLFEAAIADLQANPSLGEELFGPAALVVRHSGTDDLLAWARRLEGHLTATVHGTPEDLAENTELLASLAARVGRLVVNGFPTGVEVTPAMVHGGPYPATSGQFSSVGTRAITRFTRPVCYQDVPESALPPELHDANPLGLWRLRDGTLQKA